MKKLQPILFSLFLASSASAQQSAPGFIQGQVPTAAQWNSYFAGKLDYNSAGLPINLGGTGAMTANGALSTLGAMPNTASAISTALGYTPVSKSGDTMSGSLNVYNPTFLPSMGLNGGFRVMVGANQTTTPASADTVAGTIYVDNASGTGRGNIWTLDLLALQATGGTNGVTHGVELEVNNLNALVTDPWGAYHKDGFESVAHASSTNAPTSAFMSYSANDNGAGWWYDSYMASRTSNIGFGCEINPGGHTDTGTAFAQACFQDNSASARVLGVTGSHAIFADLSSATSIGLFAKGFSGANTNFGIWNNSLYDMEVSIGSSTASTIKQSILGFADRGTDKWRIVKDASNNFDIFNFATSNTDLTINTSTDLVTISHGLTVTGTLTVPAGSINNTALAAGTAAANLGNSPSFPTSIAGGFVRPNITTYTGLTTTLDPSPQVGDLAVISDAPACTANTTVVGGGGATSCAVMYNGTWVAVVTH